MTASSGRLRRPLPRLTGRVFDDLAVYSAAFGVLIGVVFPWLLQVLGVPSEIAQTPRLRFACILAGLVVAGVNYLLTRVVVSAQLRRLIRGMRSAREGMQLALESGDWSDADCCQVPVDSTDELGEAAANHNRLLAAIRNAHEVELDIAEIAALLAAPLDLDELCRIALHQVIHRTRAAGAAIWACALDGGRLFTEGALPGDVDIAELAEHLMSRTAADAVTRSELSDFRISVMQGREGPVGVLFVTREPAGSGVPDLLSVRHTERLVAVLATSLGAALSNALLHRQVTQLVDIDELTGLATRRAGLRQLDRSLAAVARGRGPIGVLMMDIDLFKQVNDTYGHMVGDRVLAHVAHTAQSALREEDLLIRFGGEEFLALLPNVDDDELIDVAQRLREMIEDDPGPAVQAVPRGILSTISIGAALSASPHEAPEPAMVLLNRADAALYAAKHAGRNRVMLAGTGPLSRPTGNMEDVDPVSHL